MSQRTLTTQGLVLPKFIFILISIGMIIVSAYLTNHYMDTFFPSGLKGTSNLCNISDFWGCDKATLSPLGNLAGIPTSFFGLMIGVIGLIGGVIGRKEIESTLKILFAINFLGCLILFAYSLIALGGLCPMCFVYYVLSGVGTFMLFKMSDLNPAVDVRVAGIMAVGFLIPVGVMAMHIGSKQKQKELLASSYIKQFQSLKDYGDPVTESPFKLHSASENFSDGKIRISVFSDFQCPYCKLAAEQTEEIIKDFGEKVNIQYFFYPLDSTCNTKMKGSLHPFACYSAYLAACDQEKFKEVHDYLFANQESISFEKLKEWQSKFELSGCFENESVKDYIQQTLNAGEQFSLKSTPTIIVNGKKLEGLIPYEHMKGILQSLTK
ncbi:MAG: hypothetical protein CME65_14985 [Halobacteriovoraceae bacterium]|nr:hypothetical protein [Halobacteriovoraceae bacterium]|tara:strand:- start:3037 stop:4176 length:1140 start_codon:yes stop_codon:yes gene_type:complete